MDENAANFDSEAEKQGPCNYGPVLTVNGKNPDTVLVNETYNDPGATATLIDGTAISVSTDTSQINTSTVGSFEIHYSASNEYGSATATRSVYVIIGQGNWLGNWTCTHNCDPILFPLSQDPVIIAGASETEIVIDNMFNLIGGSVNGTLDDQIITIPQQTVDITLGEIILEGSGAMSNSGNQIVIDYDFENTTPLIGGLGSCTVVYDK